jgi:hypothetical protein
MILDGTRKEIILDGRLKFKKVHAGIIVYTMENEAKPFEPFSLQIWHLENSEIPRIIM